MQIHLRKKLKMCVIALAMTVSNHSFAQNSEALTDAIALFESGDIKAAQSAFKTLKGDGLADTYLAQIMMREDLDDAEDMIEDVVDAHPKLARAHFIRGRIMGSQAGNAIFSALSYAKKSLKGFETAVELEPDSVLYQKGLFRFHVNAPSIAGGDLDIATEQVAKVKELDLEEGVLLDLELSGRKNEDEAHIAYALEVAQQYPDNAKVSFELARSYQNTKDYDKAFASLDDTVANATKSEDLQTRCMAEYQIGRTAVSAKSNMEKGIASLNYFSEQCSNVGSELPEAHWAKFRTANLLELQGKKGEAKMIYKSLKSIKDKEFQKQLKKKV
ncbi:MAG: hypothetical protein GJ680_04810 [Alteromonadaceae bacterium]|nr:hypothetical protein [Alteromonadaceae bacterium]